MVLKIRKLSCEYLLYFTVLELVNFSVSEKSRPFKVLNLWKFTREPLLPFNTRLRGYPGVIILYILLLPRKNMQTRNPESVILY